MRSTAAIATELFDAIDRWKKQKPRLVVALEGYSASGKSTLARYVAKHRDDIAVVELDNFLAPRKERQKLDSEADFHLDWRKNHWYRHRVFEKVVRAYVAGKDHVTSPVHGESGEWDETKTFDFSRPVLLVEGALILRSPLEPYIDKLVYLDTPAETRDKLRYKRRLKKLGLAGVKARKARDDKWAEKFAVLYEQYRQKFKPEDRIDLTIDTNVDNQP